MIIFSNKSAFILFKQKEFYFEYYLFLPTTENMDQDYFINDSPRNILAKGKAQDLLWITGVVSQEGIAQGFLNE